ncbi:hypothetical protein HDU98_009181 [Podochytrium sp. JEL0797]|nr:hypothetical protein HDU98_009181 [Podochytrium sp. JEL0797]
MNHPLLTPVQPSSAGNYDLDIDLDLGMEDQGYSSATMASLMHSPMPPPSSAQTNALPRGREAMPAMRQAMPAQYPQSVPQIKVQAPPADALDAFLASTGNNPNPTNNMLMQHNPMLQHQNTFYQQQPLQQQQYAPYPQHIQRLANSHFKNHLPTANDILLNSPMVHETNHNNMNPSGDLYNLNYQMTPAISNHSTAMQSPYMFVNEDQEHYGAVSPLLDLATNNNNTSTRQSSSSNNDQTQRNQHIHCPYTSICPSTIEFPTAKSLRDHVREMHQTDLVHSCAECGRGFLDLASLDSHHCRGANAAAFFGHLNAAGAAGGGGAGAPANWGTAGGAGRRRSSSGMAASAVAAAAAGGGAGFTTSGLGVQVMPNAGSSNGSVHSEEEDGAEGKKKRANSNTPTITCDYEGCGKTFNLQKSYIVHLRTHTGEKPHICTYPSCHKAFAQPSGLRSHIFTHTGERPYKCTLCTKTYTTSSRLKIHFRAHTNEEPYVCDFAGCSRRFKQKSNLDQHVVTHLDPEVRERLHKNNKKEVACAECGRMYKNYASLDQHCWREHGRGVNDVLGMDVTRTGVASGSGVVGGVGELQFYVPGQGGGEEGGEFAPSFDGSFSTDNL